MRSECACWLISALVLLVGWTGGCGYSTRRPFPTDINSVHVEMLHSKEFRRELEYRLTEAIIKRIEMDTPYRITPRRSDLRTGKLLVDRRRFVYQTSYIPPVGETFSQGMTRALDGLAEGIVETMETAW